MGGRRGRDDSDDDSDSERGEEGEENSSAEDEDSNDDEEVRSGTRTKKAQRKRPHGEAKEAKPKARRASKAEVRAIKKFVPSLIRAAVDGKSALPVVGAASKEKMAQEGRSLLAVFEFLSKVVPPPGTLQAAIDAVGGTSKLLDGWRRVPHLVVTTDLISITALLNDKALAPVLKDEHAEQISSEGGARALALQGQQMLITLETKCQYAAIVIGVLE